MSEEMKLFFGGEGGEDIWNSPSVGGGEDGGGS